LDKEIIQQIFLLFLLLFFTKERVRAGLEQARSRGIRLGRPPLVQFKENEIKAYFKKTKNVSSTARKFKISRRSVSRVVK